MKAVVYPGSFDPPTHGHMDIIKRASFLFDRVYVLVAKSFDKKAWFTFQEREQMLQELTQKEGLEAKVQIVGWSGLTTDFLRKHNLNCIVRGVRSSVDFQSEQTLANINSHLLSGCETLLLCCKPEFRDLSSRMVKEIALHKGSLKGFVSNAVSLKIHEKVQKGL